MKKEKNQQIKIPNTSVRRTDNLESLRLECKYLPECPGVYRYYDSNNKLIYVGKAVNLKRRMQNYFSNTDPDTIDEKTRRLIYSVKSFKIIRTYTEFEALVLEDKLIKEHAPEFNIKQNRDKESFYIHISDNEYPFIELLTSKQIKKKNPDSNFYKNIYGPFGSFMFSDHIRKILIKYFKIRNCTTKTPREDRPFCFDDELGICTGPCKKKGVISYNYQINNAIKFLKGRNFDFTAKLKIMSLLSKKAIYDYETVKEFSKRQKIIYDFIENNRSIIKGGYEYLFEKGLIKSIKELKSDENLCDCIENKQPQNPLYFFKDRAYIVHNELMKLTKTNLQNY